jgi:membrane protease subunit HflK
MSDEHEHPHEHAGPETPAPSGPVMKEDAGSQALAEALKSSFFLVKVVMVALVVVFVWNCFFTVGPQERKVVLRLGRAQGEGTNALLGPGLHWAFPAPIDEVVTIPYSGSLTVKSTVGWYRTTPEKEAANQEDPPGESLNPAVDGYTMTGDGNIIHARATLSYKVDEPILYAFNFVNASNVVRDALDNALLFASARFRVDDVLGGGKVKFREAVQTRVDELVQAQKLGIAIEQCQVEAIPPRRLKDVFELVTVTQTAAETFKNNAVNYRNLAINRAQADASSLTNAAAAERTSLLASIQADSRRFLDLLPQYEANRGLVRSILLNETVSQVMTNAQGKWLLQDTGGGQGELRIQYSPPPLSAPKPVAVPTSGSSRIE